MALTENLKALPAPLGVSAPIRGHPGNFRAPQPIRVHPLEPFICFAPQMAGDMEITHDKAYRSEYRFVTFDAAPDK